ncbi:MAG: FAD-dependent oxidoreductase, partial [Acetobacteraceae bacterium]
MRTVGNFNDLPTDRGKCVEIGSEKILLIRDGDAVRAYCALCPHAQGPLEQGALIHGRIVCPWHKATFRAADGALLEPPALEPLTRYPVRLEKNGDILVSPTGQRPKATVPPPERGSIVIVGAGAAGTAAAAALREMGNGCEITLIGEEPGAPYDRTSLSKFVVAGTMEPEAVPPLRPPGFAAALRIRRLTTEVVRLDARARCVYTKDGRIIPYQAALIATGGVPRRLDIPGADLAGVYTLRNRRDAAGIIASAREAANVVVLGSSFIGLEVASALRELGRDVAVVSPEAVPFTKQLGPRMGGLFKALHEENGVVFHPGTRAARLTGSRHVEAVVLEDGGQLPAQLVIVGVGVRPATKFLSGVPLGEDGGIPVDGGMRAAEDVYAAGDVAAFPLPHGSERRVRIEHWRVAEQQGRIAARNLLGGAERYSGVPFFWTYHYGKRFEYLGHAER